jgi:hypothetical protein
MRKTNEVWMHQLPRLCVEFSAGTTPANCFVLLFHSVCQNIPRYYSKKPFFYFLFGFPTGYILGRKFLNSLIKLNNSVTILRRR